MNSECSICFEIVRSNATQKPFVTRCGHLFHENCIKNCFQNVTYGKCPQCNQTVIASQLIRLFVNEPENSIKAKDELIEQLKSQLNDLNEKAQLQYDLIGSLNRQISMEKELSHQRVKAAGSRHTATSTSIRLNPASCTIAPAVLNVPKRVASGVQPKFGTIPKNSNFKPVPSLPAEPMSQTPFGSSNVFGNEKDNAGQFTFSFGETKSTEAETLGAVGWSAPAGKASQNQISTFTFGSKPTLGSFNTDSFKFMSNNSSTFGQGFNEASMSELATEISTTSSSQSNNVFAPMLTTKQRTSKPIFKFKSPSSTIAPKKSFTNSDSSCVSFNFSPTFTTLFENAVEPSKLEDFFRNLPKQPTSGNIEVTKLEKVFPENEDSEPM